MNRIKLVCQFFLILFFCSCANKVAPTGGPRDVKPPELAVSNPPNGTVSFNATKITLTFNEYVQLKEASKQIVVSPPVTPAPRFSATKKNIVVEFDSLLNPNTTYNINFGNAITDNNEGNPLAGFQYTFSTGTYIDSLMVNGRVRDALTRKPVEGAIAILYRVSIPDSLLLRTSPSYFARTSADGKFNITNVASGSYRMFALLEKNNNYLFDQTDESAGFVPELISAGDTTQHEIRIFKPKPTKQFIRNCNLLEAGKAEVILAIASDSISYKFIGSAPQSFVESRNEYGDTLHIYTTPAIRDSLVMVFSEYGTVIDTAVCKMSRSATLRKAPKFTGYQLLPATNSELAPENNPMIRWNFPLTKINTSLISLTGPDSVTLAVNASFTDSAKTKLEFQGNWKEGEYTVKLLPGAVTDMQSLSNDTIQWTFSIASDRSRGSISFEVSTTDSTAKILQLVTDKDEVVRERYFTGKLNGIFEKLIPENYRLRVITDTNSNKRWDVGDFRKGIQPENVIYYSERMMVRANWEVEMKFEF